ncbi:deoxyribose-phosphate aldolase [Clostridium beijerinckii]|uniref:Deoxyribose-phosphate aldolase n=1 Tax=Clostridium beijerinckii TaxID=1520 RepID=A0AAX0B889_CLOBE|nr:deoxyribose-phosphate aldolase [Clostridium beijerinckii]MBA8933189.1 deoxyribose-phosphate aldolase [Clostridium beijerinckii]NRT36864.1 deoxyribose-phosphate aldolase [Clostridium beijerinckii]NRT43702.1 deoxyribose-phosphate aldolase [Clostridium beijerinckii]NRT91607.1 deoxyribose-phosphate aldolase [Clostridium beijerinckii]NRU37390.1 deoxyribose-phosphate aldolase [Clostridium beijerinckii]
MNIAKYIDHTILKPEATVEDVKKLCKEAKEYNFASVCVNGCYAKLVSSELMGTDVKTCVVVGFPLGAMTKEAKAFETNQAIENGATEIDMVINVGALKDKNYSLLKEDIEAVVNAAKGKALVKVIIETCLLTDEEKVKACEIAKEAKADFVKTSTGFSSGGATKEDIALMRKTVGPDLGVKASGGVRDFKAAMEMINAGASRIGASASISIVSESK